MKCVPYCRDTSADAHEIACAACSARAPLAIPNLISLAGYHGHSGRRATLYGADTWLQSAPRWDSICAYLDSGWGLKHDAERFEPGIYHSSSNGWFLPAGALLEVWDAAP